MNKRILNYFLIGGLLAVPVILLLLPANFFDTGQSICLSVLLFDTQCLGCGMTRAIQHILHFDFETAWNFNKLSFIVFPILAFLYIRTIFRLYRSTKNGQQNLQA